jgi:hypothetical protein
VTGELGPGAARRLLGRRRLAIDPTSGAAVKRNVHEFLIDAPAERFAQALADILVEPGADFAGLTILRLPGRAGRSFLPGERFQAAFRGVAVESSEIELIEPFRARYVYLTGAPFVGSSTFVVEPDGPRRTRFTAIFELQERGLLGVALLHGFGIRAHDRVVAAQAALAAARTGATVVQSTIRPPGTTVPGTRDPSHQAPVELPLR